MYCESHVQWAVGYITVDIQYVWKAILIKIFYYVYFSKIWATNYIHREVLDTAIIVSSVYHQWSAGILSTSLNFGSPGINFWKGSISFYIFKFSYNIHIIKFLNLTYSLITFYMCVHPWNYHKASQCPFQVNILKG